jgi:hypothetical protein
MLTLEALYQINLRIISVFRSTRHVKTRQNASFEEKGEKNLLKVDVHKFGDQGITIVPIFAL